MNKNSFVFRVARFWLPLAAVTAGLILFAVVVGQQDARLSFNDPQMQAAEDAATALSAGATPESVLPATHVDIGKSLALYVIVYDAAGKPIAGSGTLHGELPSLPSGVLGSYKANWGLTWQPEAAVRTDIVAKPYTSGASTGYVIAGRNMSYLEQREEVFSELAFLAFIVLNLGSLILITVLEYFFTCRK